MYGGGISNTKTMLQMYTVAFSWAFVTGFATRTEKNSCCSCPQCVKGQRDSSVCKGAEGQLSV